MVHLCALVFRRTYFFYCSPTIGFISECDIPKCLVLTAKIRYSVDQNGKKADGVYHWLPGIL
jgi:hypothetical protein